MNMFVQALLSVLNLMSSSSSSCVSSSTTSTPTDFSADEANCHCNPSSPRRFRDLLTFGTYLLPLADTYACVLSALRAGYRRIDTATAYKNEREVARAIRAFLDMHTNDAIQKQHGGKQHYVVDRCDIHVTSKLSQRSMSSEQTAYDGVCASVNEMAPIVPIDLYLLHWPGCFGIASTSTELATHRADAWRSLCRARSEGKVRNVGVSNFDERHFPDLMKSLPTSSSSSSSSTNTNIEIVPPHTNQIELHPLMYSRSQPLLSFCVAHTPSRIAIQAYSPLGSADGLADLLSVPLIQTLAKQHGVSTATVCLLYGLQHGWYVIVKSGRRSHIWQNVNELDDVRVTLNEEEMSQLDELGKVHPGCSDKGFKKYCWDPASVS